MKKAAVHLDSDVDSYFRFSIVAGEKNLLEEKMMIRSQPNLE